MAKTTFPAVASTAIVCFAFWLLLTNSFAAQELIAGGVVSVAVALFSARFLIHEDSFWLFHPKRFCILFLINPAVFTWELIKANWDVAKRAFHPGKPNVNPGTVKVPTNIKSEYGLASLSNAITLTPGTITLDVAEENGQNYIYIHWIDVTETNGEAAGEIIKGTLEKWIARIWR